MRVNVQVDERTLSHSGNVRFSPADSNMGGSGIRLSTGRKQVYGGGRNLMPKKNVLL